MMAVFRRAMDRYPAFAGCLGAVLAAVAMLGWPSVWIAAVLAAIVLLAAALRHYFWFLVGAVVTVVSAQLTAPAELGAEYYYNEKLYVCEVREVKTGANSLRLKAEACDGERHFPIRVNIMGTDPALRPGDSLGFTGCLRPVGTQKILNGFLLDRSTRLSASVQLRPEQVEVKSRSHSLRYLPARLAEHLRAWIERCSLSDRTCSLLTVSLFGLTDGQIENIDAFRGVGIAHLLCVSGFHVGLVYMFFYNLLIPMVFWRGGRQLRPLLILPAVWLFVMMTGAGAPAVRAGVMITLVVLGMLLERDRMSLNSLYVALLVIVWLNPASVFSVGVWLGSLTVAALITGTRLLNRFQPGTLMFGISENVSGCMVGSVATFPVQAAVFHSVPVFSMIANILVVPVFPVFITGAMSLVVVEGMGLNASWLAWGCEAVAGYFDWVAETVYHHPRSVVSGLYFSSGGLWLLFGALGCLFMACWLKGWKLKTGSTVLAAAMVVAAFALPERVSASEVVFEDDSCMLDSGPRLEMYVFRSRVDRESCATYLEVRGRRLEELRVIHDARYMAVGDDTVHFVGTRYPFDRNLSGHTVYVRSNSRAAIDSLVSGAFAPRRVVLSERLRPDVRRRLVRHFGGRGVPVHDLWLEPLVLPSL